MSGHEKTKETKNGNLKRRKGIKKVHKLDEDCESCYILDPYLTVIVYISY